MPSNKYILENISSHRGVIICSSHPSITLLTRFQQRLLRFLVRNCSPVGDRSAGTLLKIIKDRVKPGSTIISDCWRAYDCLESEGYQHLKVNHSLNFVDPCLHGSRCQTLPSVIFIKGKWLLFLSCNLF